MNKAEMADHLAVRTGMNKVAARDAVDSVFATIGEALANGDEVRFAGFGTYGTRNRPARTDRNPPDRRGDLDIGVEITVVQGREDTQGRSERRWQAVTSD